MKEIAGEYVDFDIVSEPWSTWRLSDGSRLRAKFVLLKVREKGAGVFEFGSQLLTVVEPTHIMATPPTSPPSQSDVHASVEPISISFKPISRGIVKYRIKGKHVLQVELELTRVRRTTLYNVDGERIYLVDTHARLVPLQR